MQKENKIVTAFLLAVLIVVSVLPSFVQTYEAAATSNDVFSIMQISDTQHLALVSPTLYKDTTSWIVNNSASYNVQMVVHTGDMIDDRAGQSGPIYNASQRAQQWVIANASMGKLLDARIPYCWSAGNHEQIPFASSSGTSDWNNYLAFNATYMRSKSYWVSDIYNSKNTATKFTVNNYTFMIVNVEFMANSSTLTWMKRLLDDNPSANIVVATHGYLSVRADYGSSIPPVAAWQNAFKKTLDSYPNVFLALSGHVYTSTTSANMTRVEGRQEILFDRQEANNQTGAASVRIYTFNLTSKKVNTTTYAVDKQTWLNDPYNQFTFDASITSDWTMTTEGRPLKAYPDLKEYIWQKNARMLPNGQYDKIGLHRLVKTGVAVKGVIFIIPNFANGGDEYTSNPSTDSWTKIENYAQAIYWANRGFEIYAIDMRTHSVPITLNLSQLSFMKDWGWDVYISDAKEAVNKAKEVSGTQKMFLVSYSQGARTAMNYAAKYWREDLRGIILESAVNYETIGVLGKRGNETNTYNFTAQINNVNSAGNWANENSPLSNIRMMKYALENPGAPAQYHPGTPLSPAINPLTNKSWTNITERNTYFWSVVNPVSNALGGYGNITQLEYTYSVMDRWVPSRIYVEASAMTDWINCPYLTYDYDDHFSEIEVPVLVFSGLSYSNRTGTFRGIKNGLGTSDFTVKLLPNYGSYDLFLGAYSARDVSQPALEWMTSHYQPPAASTFSSVTVFAGQSWYFCVHSNGGVGPHKYQWYEGTTPITGQTDMVLRASKPSAGTYTYYCKVTDAEGATANSSPVTLTVK